MNIRKSLKAFWKFSRPHTIIGTSLSVFGLYLMALVAAPPVNLHLSHLALALLSCLGANIYIVGLNQLTDIEIDRINKPDLPLASGRFSRKTGRIIVILSLLLSLAIAIYEGRFLLITVVVSLIIGTGYSLPPLRLKRFHFWAAACIFTVRGVVVNLFLFLHFSDVLNHSEAIPARIWVLTTFIFGLSLVIAWFKDIPDMEGDRRFRIMTLSLRLGPARVFQLGRGLLAAGYVALIIAGFIGIPGINTEVFAVSHLSLLAALWMVSRQVNPARRESVALYYRFIWVLFFSEYIFFAAACLFA